MVAVAGAQAADLPVKAKPVQYVKICSLYGAGFYYMPGTDTCLKVGGYVRAEVNFNSGGSFAPAFGNHSTASYNENNWRVRAAITLDARSQTEYGTLRSYLFVSSTDDNSVGGGYAAPGAYGGTGGYASASNSGGASGYNRLYAPTAFIQFAGFTAGKTGSFFDFDGQPYSNQSNIWSSNNGGNGVELFAYTAQFGNGLSASIAAENNNGHRLGVTADGTNWIATSTGGAYANTTYGGQSAPDIVANLRIDQAWGSAQVMGAAHQITYASTATGVAAPGSEWGYAVGGGLKVNLPMIGAKDYVIGQLTYAEGAIDYVGSGLAVGTGNSITQSGVTTTTHAWDSVVTGAGTAEKTKGWSITGGFEHFWNAQWKTSLYGSYGALKYSSAASAVLTGAGTSANWNYWQVGSRTVWTPVANLDLSVDVMYQKMDNDLVHTATVGSNDWVSGMFRVQRNFYP